MMDLVIDANALIAALIKQGNTSLLLFSPRLQLFSPAYLLTEVRKHKEIIKAKAAMSDDEFDTLLNMLSRRITFVEDADVAATYAEAERISPDRKDTPYLALA